MPLSGVRARINIGDVLPPFDPTSKTTIQIRDLNGARVFPVSAHVNENGGRSLPGKFVCNRGGIGGLFMSSWGLDRDETAEIRANGGESELLIDMRGMQWVKSTDRGEKPDGVRAVVGGTGAAGEEIFHAIGWRDGVRVPGWTKEGMGGALIGYANKGWCESLSFNLYRTGAEVQKLECPHRFCLGCQLCESLICCVSNKAMFSLSTL